MIVRAAVAAGLAGLALGVFGTATLLNARHAEQMAAADLAAMEQVAVNSEHALTRYRQLETQKNDALKAAQDLIARNRADASAARAERDRLRADLARVPARIAAASRAAVDEYAATVTVIFEQCTERYSGLAGKADGHAADAGALEAGWPR